MKKRERTDEVEDEIKTEPPETDKENNLNGGGEAVDRVGELRDAHSIGNTYWTLPSLGWNLYLIQDSKF